MSEFCRVDKNIFGLTRDKPVGLWVSQAEASHVGLAYLCVKDDGGLEERILHLSGSERLLDDPIDFKKSKKQYFIAHSSLPNDVENGKPASSLAIFLSEVSNTTENIKFGVDWIGSRGAFDSNGQYTPPPEGGGLTCATFVSELLSGHGVDVVDAETWVPNSKSALDWRDDLVAGFKKRLPGLTGEDANRYQALIKNVEECERVVRLKPAQIAGAATSNWEFWPMNEVEADGIAQKIINDFKIAFGK